MMEFLEEYEGLLKADGFDEAILGVGCQKGSEPAIIYDYNKCVEILMEDMSFEDAVEHMEFNVVDAYVGPQTPIFLRRPV